jgi:nucleoside-diphosphate-sugar epimerase
MGILRPSKSKSIDIDEFSKLMLSCAFLPHKTDDGSIPNRLPTTRNHIDGGENELVCVTSGVSFLGLEIVKELLLRGYSVRITIDNEEDIEKLREMELSGEMRGTNGVIEVASAKLNESGSVLEAFQGCSAVFHTAAFIDPAGLSGYSKYMAEIEAKATENVIEACASTPSVRKCVLTSSLLACTWQENDISNISRVIDHDSWSNESFCREKKLWYALGKLKSEKAAWRIAEEKGLKLTTICPGLITGQNYLNRNPTSTLAYLKGGQEMYENGVLAVVDVNKLAKAHVRVFEAINKTSFGRYICFDEVIKSETEVEKLVQETRVQINVIPRSSFDDIPTRFKLSNAKLDRLMSSRTERC